MNKYDYIFLAGLALWLFETAAFGWHETATSVPEKMFDVISLFLIAYGALAGIVTSLSPKVIINLKTSTGARIHTEEV